MILKGIKKMNACPMCGAEIRWKLDKKSFCYSTFFLSKEMHYKNKQIDKKAVLAENT